MNIFHNGKNSKDVTDQSSVLAAANKSLAIIEFSLDGTILDANENFLSTMGYTLDEVKGRHHSIFVTPEYRESAEYKEFWRKLKAGQFDRAEYRRVGKGGKEIWILASYNPVFDDRGAPYKVVKFATDITQQKIDNAIYEGQVFALSKSFAVIHFAPDGTILNANDRFLFALGYTLEEIKGKKHSMFVPKDYAQSKEYASFWDRLRRGEYESGEFKRVRKNGKDLWIQATYNPILDQNGKLVEVVKFALDVTQQKLRDADYKGQINAINTTQAVIHFEPDGTIISANDLFLKTMGYRLSEIQGKHHRMFVHPEEVESQDYKDLWDNLRAGKPDSRVFRRVAKDGKDVWLTASYNPICDESGEVFKVVKYARDITIFIDMVEETNKSVKRVSNSTVDLSSSITEINKNMALTQDATREIVQKTTESGEATENLLVTMKSMASILKLIRDIANQVNLLALNATVEAARAGDAGRSFAVVASEVKNLARQTASATDDISTQIQKLQEMSSQVASSVNEIVQIANKGNDYVNNIANSIESQTALTEGISADAERASQAVTDIVERVRRVN